MKKLIIGILMVVIILIAGCATNSESVNNPSGVTPTGQKTPAPIDTQTTPRVIHTPDVVFTRQPTSAPTPLVTYTPVTYDKSKVPNSPIDVIYYYPDMCRDKCSRIEAVFLHLMTSDYRDKISYYKYDVNMFKIMYNADIDQYKFTDSVPVVIVGNGIKIYNNDNINEEELKTIIDSRSTYGNNEFNPNH
jgi:hypothetical protein